MYSRKIVSSRYVGVWGVVLSEEKAEHARNLRLAGFTFWGSLLCSKLRSFVLNLLPLFATDTGIRLFPDR